MHEALVFVGNALLITVGVSGCVVIIMAALVCIKKMWAELRKDV